MIIICEKCNKKFNLDEKLIPENGRLLKCGGCDYEWHFLLNKDPFLLKDESYNNNEEKQLLENNELSANNNIVNGSENEKIKSNIKNSNVANKTKNNNYFVSYLLVSLITLSAIIIVLDTFKLKLSFYVPTIIPFLDNLYQSLNDVFLFSKNLFY